MYVLVNPTFSFYCIITVLMLYMRTYTLNIYFLQADGEKPIRNFLDDPRRSGPIAETDRKEGSRRHVRNWGGVDFDNVKTGPEVEKEWTVLSRLTCLFSYCK